MSVLKLTILSVLGLYVARPTKLDNTEDNEELVAQFTDFKLVASDGAKNK